PTGAIHGQIELSTGDPAQGITVMLLKRAVQDGRALWQGAGTARTNSEGLYRFGGLTDGVYAMYTEPAMDNEPATDLMEAGRAPVERAGYASVFYPDARDLAGAAHIQLRGGDQAQANLTLTLEPFHAVTATVTFPQDRPSGSGPAEPSCSALVMDAAG